MSAHKIKHSVAGSEDTHPLSVGVVKGFKLDDVRVSNDAHDLQLAILQTVKLRTCAEKLRADARTLKRLS